jgi:predicted AAA+ superfamily ATPase
MYRKAMRELEVWKNKRERKPLVIRGARQTGKTWLMREFGRSYFDDALVVSFDANERAAQVFSPDLEPRRVVRELETLYQCKITPGQTLIIFDEIQECSQALRALKYFCEDAPEFHVIAAGSYLGVSMHQGVSFPVGKVDLLNLYPLDFEEFLLALEHDQLATTLANGDMSKFRLFKEDYLAVLKKYLYVGGMPEVVAEFVEHGNYVATRETQQKLLTMYDLDFSKHVPAVLLPKVRALFASVPVQLAKENKKFQYAEISKSARGRDYEAAMMWLIDMGVIYRVHRVNQTKHPLASYSDERAFKLFSLDVGLVSAQSGLNWQTLHDRWELFGEFRGALTEQYVLSQLIASIGIHPYYWGSDTGHAEVDFLIEVGSEPVPIEVKSGTHMRSKSLASYITKTNPRFAVRTSPADYRRSSVNNSTQVIELPLYALSLLPQLIGR